MELDFVDRAILDNMRGSVGVSELADRTGFARTTVLMHLHRLERLGIVVREKVFTGRRGRPIDRSSKPDREYRRLSYRPFGSHRAF